MRFYQALILLSSCSCLTRVYGFPPHHGGHQWHGSEPDGHEFQAPSPYDSRSPCPGLNALANHGWLPRNGMDISLADINTATEGAMNYAHGAFAPVFQQIIDYQLSSTGDPSTFNLRDLAVHDTIEKDGSQTRNDIYFGDDLHFDPTVFDIVAKTLDIYDESESRFVTIDTAAKARAARVAEDMSLNPTFNASDGAQMMGSIGTTALYLLSMWDDNAQAAPKPWVLPFLSEDRIPYLEGFEKPQKVKTPERLAAISKAIGDVSV